MKSSKGKGPPKRPDGRHGSDGGKRRDESPRSLPREEVSGWRSRRSWLLVLVASLAVAGLVRFLTRDDPHRLLREGEALLDRDPRQAGILFEKSVALAGGDFPHAQVMLCVALGRQRRWLEALGGLSLIKEKSAGDGRRFMELATAAFAAGEPILAEQALEAAGQTSVPETELLKALIPVRLTLGHEVQALAECRRLAALDPEAPEPHITEARLLRRRRETLAASAAYRAALKRIKQPAESATVRREFVEVLVQEGNAIEARREFDQIPPSSSAADQLALLRAYILRLEGNSRAALEQVERFLASHPDHADAMLLEGTLSFDLGAADRTVATLGRLTEREPFNKEAHYLLGRAHLQLGHTEVGKRHLATSQKLAAMVEEIVALEGLASQHPEDPKTLLRLAELYDATGKPDLASQCRQAAARSQPE